MRKIRKINGYLVVRFNDREKRLNEGTALGSFGVIDAELYTGILDVDRSVMEYDSAETLEEAIEQARGLDSELDVEEPQVKITVVKESDTESSEEEIDPANLFLAEKAALESVNANCTVPGLDDFITAQRLYGYARALMDLGVADISDERFQVDPDIPPDCVLASMPYANAGKYSSRRLTEEPPERGHASLSQAAAQSAGQKQNEQENFLHPPSGNQIYPKIYALGMQLLKDCPDNDCMIFRSTFQIVLDTDRQIDLLTGFLQRWLSHRIQREYHYLEQMFCFNHAVKAYRGQHPPEPAYPDGEGAGGDG